jgi:hypothetical protein
MRFFLLVLATCFPFKIHGHTYIDFAKKMLWGDNYLTENTTLRGAQEDCYYVRTFDDDGQAVKIECYDYFFKDEFDFSDLGNFLNYKKIYFKNCTFSKSAFEKFLELFGQNLATREMIGFSHVMLQKGGMLPLIKLLKKCRNLKKIRFVNNDLSENDVQELIIAISNKPIEKIVLEENLSNLSTIFLLQLLLGTPNLKHLSISWRQPYVSPFWRMFYAQDLEKVREYYFIQMIKSLSYLPHLKVLKLKCQGLYDSFDFNLMAPHLTAYLRSDSARNTLKRFWILTSTENHYPFEEQVLSYLPFDVRSTNDLLESLPPQLDSFKLSGLTFDQAFEPSAEQKRHLVKAKLSGKYKHIQTLGGMPCVIRYTREKGIVYNQDSE